MAALPRVAVLVGVASSMLSFRAAAHTCRPEQTNHTPGFIESFVTVDGAERRFLVHLPADYAALGPMQLWILAPGAFNGKRKQIAMSDLVQPSEEQQVAFVAIEGEKKLMNVRRNSQPDPARPHDVAYTRAMLDAVRELICVDDRRIFCTGYSRGARFCSRLASELSDTIAAIAPVSGIRFPRPNNATRAMPIMAFHGTGDPINPFPGNGNPEYWYDSVPAAIQQWADFNGCTQNETIQLNPGISFERHTDCRDGADVVLVRIENGGHTWPGSRFKYKGLGMTSHLINASTMMGAFFSLHPMPEKAAGGSWASFSTIAIVLLAVAVAVLLAMLLRSKKAPDGDTSSSESDADEEING